MNVNFAEELPIHFQRISATAKDQGVKRDAFPVYFTLLNYVFTYKRKEKIRMTNNKTTPYPYLYTSYTGKVSLFTPVKGSITVEAALAVPFFFFAVVCLIFLFEIMAIQTSVRSGLQYAGKMIAEECYPLSVINSENVEKYVVDAVGADRLERSIVVGGSTGIDCNASSMSVRTGIGKLTVTYQIRIPVPMIRIEGITREESIRIKAWTGYEREFFGVGEEEMVYVTENGIVYHKDYHCTYLELSIRMVTAESIESLRNSSGGKYYSCRLCGGGSSTNVYITDDGDKYHCSLSCSGLKRTVYAVPLSEVVGKGACIRCVR